MKLLGAMSFLLLLAACAGQGTFGRAGKNADDAIGNVREGVGDVVDDVRDGVEDVKHDVERSRRRADR